jgi:uncharacterized protein YchJ
VQFAFCSKIGWLIAALRAAQRSTAVLALCSLDRQRVATSPHALAHSRRAVYSAATKHIVTKILRPSCQALSLRQGEQEAQQGSVGNGGSQRLQ